MELIQWVKGTIAARPGFFDAVGKWYKNVNLCRKVACKLLSRESAGARVSLLANGHLLAGEAITVPAQARHVDWVLANGTLMPGINEITVLVEEESSPVHVRAATAKPEAGTPRQM